VVDVALSVHNYSRQDGAKTSGRTSQSVELDWEERERSKLGLENKWISKHFLLCWLS
jgi:hypothetical protein